MKFNWKTSVMATTLGMRVTSVLNALSVFANVSFEEMDNQATFEAA